MLMKLKKKNTILIIRCEKEFDKIKHSFIIFKKISHQRRTIRELFQPECLYLKTNKETANIILSAEILDVLPPGLGTGQECPPSPHQFKFFWRQLY